MINNGVNQYVASDTITRVSYDSGLTWTASYTEPTVNNNTFNWLINSISYDTTKYIAFTNDTAYISTDNGLSFITKAIPDKTWLA